MAKKPKTNNPESGVYSLYAAGDVERINERAYYVWEKKGRPQDSAVQDWVEAERELREEGLIG